MQLCQSFEFTEKGVCLIGMKGEDWREKLQLIPGVTVSTSISNLASTSSPLYTCSIVACCCSLSHILESFRQLRAYETASLNRDDSMTGEWINRDTVGEQMQPDFNVGMQ